MGIFKNLFGTSGELLVQNPQNNTVISQQGQMQQGQGYQGITNSALYAQQQNFWGINNQQQQNIFNSGGSLSIQSLQAAMNQMTGIYDSWIGAKYNKEEIKMAINQKTIINFPLGDSQEVVIKDFDDIHITIQDDYGCLMHYNPCDIIYIPFIDKLRKTKLYRMINNGY